MEGGLVVTSLFDAVAACELRPQDEIEIRYLTEGMAPDRFTVSELAFSESVQRDLVWLGWANDEKESHAVPVFMHTYNMF